MILPWPPYKDADEADLAACDYYGIPRDSIYLWNYSTERIAFANGYRKSLMVETIPINYRAQDVRNGSRLSFLTKEF